MTRGIDIDEKVVLKKAFDLILSFDDVITLGYRESVQMSQLEAYLEMDSTDERIFKRQQKIREAEAKEQAKRVQKELAKKRMSAGAVNDPKVSMSSADFQTNENAGMNQKMEQMQNNPTSNGGTFAEPSGVPQQTAQSSGSAMFGGPSVETEQLGARKAAGGG